MAEAVKVEIKKRSDGQYNVYRLFTFNAALRLGKEELFYCDVEDYIFKAIAEEEYT